MANDKRLNDNLVSFLRDQKVKETGAFSNCPNCGAKMDGERKDNA